MSNFNFFVQKLIHKLNYYSLMSSNRRSWVVKIWVSWSNLLQNAPIKTLVMAFLMNSALMMTMTESPSSSTHGQDLPATRRHVLTIGHLVHLFRMAKLSTYSVTMLTSDSQGLPAILDYCVNKFALLWGEAQLCLPYFGVKLSCVCLMFAYRKK